MSRLGGLSGGFGSGSSLETSQTARRKRLRTESRSHFRCRKLEPEKVASSGFMMPFSRLVLVLDRQKGVISAHVRRQDMSLRVGGGGRAVARARTTASAGGGRASVRADIPNTRSVAGVVFLAGASNTRRTRCSCKCLT
jgi:hypothetical protein